MSSQNYTLKPTQTPIQKKPERRNIHHLSNAPKNTSQWQEITIDQILDTWPKGGGGDFKFGGKFFEGHKPMGKAAQPERASLPRSRYLELCYRLTIFERLLFLSKHVLRGLLPRRFPLSPFRRKRSRTFVAASLSQDSAYFRDRDAARR